ncbi:LysR family transcriptional regulator [Thalassospira sp. CH_XMU1448-2]|uniref:LysR family transcriptional regulator n=1 Tax=Thalassospira sp. CH_XMU1448-2 TaxID=3107773 RepID=UPI00300893D9
MEHLQNLDDLAIFANLVDAGSLRRGSTQMRIPVATLSRRLQKLEAALGCKLLDRGGGIFSLTEAGREYYNRIKPIMSELALQLDEIDQRQSQCAGLLRLALPVNLANYWLPDFFSDFMTRYPRIELHLTLSNAILPEEDFPFDIAIRVGKQTRPSLMMRRLAGTWLVPCAGPSYLARKGYPTSPADLANHDMIISRPLLTWRFYDRKTGNEESVPATGRFNVDEMEMAIKMVRKGHGLGLFAHNIIADDLAAGTLVPILSDWDTEMRDFYAVWHETDFMPMRQRVFIDELAAFALRNPPDKDALLSG